MVLCGSRWLKNTRDAPLEQQGEGHAHQRPQELAPDVLAGRQWGRMQDVAHPVLLVPDDAQAGKDGNKEGVEEQCRDPQRSSDREF